MWQVFLSETEQQWWLRLANNEFQKHKDAQDNECYEDDDAIGVLWPVD